MPKMQNTSNIKYEEWELCDLYRKSRDKQYQVRILSDLNCTPVEQIIDILKFNGEDLSEVNVQKLFDNANKKYSRKKEKTSQISAEEEVVI